MYQLSWSQFLSPLDLAWLIWHDILIFNKPRPNKVNPRLYEKKRIIFFFLDNMQQRSSTNFDGQPHCWVSAVIQSERAKYKPQAELNYKAEEIFTMLNRVESTRGKLSEILLYDY